jgi:hypothetical protein
VGLFGVASTVAAWAADAAAGKASARTCSGCTQPLDEPGARLIVLEQLDQSFDVGVRAGAQRRAPSQLVAKPSNSSNQFSATRMGVLAASSTRVFTRNRPSLDTV